MPPTSLRKARTDLPLARIGPTTGTALLPGEWFVEQRTELVSVFSDAEGTDHVGDVALVDFLDGLALRQIVFVSWG